MQIYLACIKHTAPVCLSIKTLHPQRHKNMLYQNWLIPYMKELMDEGIC